MPGVRGSKVLLLLLLTLRLLRVCVVTAAVGALGRVQLLLSYETSSVATTGPQPLLLKLSRRRRMGRVDVGGLPEGTVTE